MEAALIDNHFFSLKCFLGNNVVNILFQIASVLNLKRDVIVKVFPISFYFYGKFYCLHRDFFFFNSSCIKEYNLLVIEVAISNLWAE